MGIYGTGGTAGGWTDELYSEYTAQKKDPNFTAAWDKKWTDAYGNPNANAPNQTPAKVDYTPVASTAGPTPSYTGLMGGDYDKLQSALAVKGGIAAKNAYDTGTQNLNNTMSGRGLYGSSLMQQQQTKGLDREYMNALATNEATAAATRYGLQQSDLQKAADVSLGGYGINRTADTAANNLAGQIGIANASNATTLQNTGLLGLNAANVERIQADTSRYAADQGLLGQQGNNATTLAVANLNNKTQLTDIQAKLDAAKGTANYQKIVDSLKLGGYLIDNYGKISKVGSSIYDATGNLFDWASTGLSDWWNGADVSGTDDPTYWEY